IEISIHKDKESDFISPLHDAPGRCNDDQQTEYLSADIENAAAQTEAIDTLARFAVQICHHPFQNTHERVPHAQDRDGLNIVDDFEGEPLHFFLLHIDDL